MKKFIIIIVSLFITNIIQVNIVRAQQTFPIQMEGEYLCEQRYGCASSFKLFIESDSSDPTKFIFKDSCPQNWNGQFVMQMYADSFQFPHEYYDLTTPCNFHGKLYLNNDSLYAHRDTYGCGSGCTCSLHYKCK